MIYTLAWIVMALWFVVWETLALKRKKGGDTLSEHVWWLLKRGPVVWWAGAGFLTWLFGHFLLGGWPGMPF